MLGRERGGRRGLFQGEVQDGHLFRIPSGERRINRNEIIPGHRFGNRRRGGRGNHTAINTGTWFLRP